MKLKKVTEIDGTEITAVDIRADSDMILIPKGSRIKKEYINSLQGLGIQEIFVESYSRRSRESSLKERKGNDQELFPKEMIDYYTYYVHKILEKHTYNKSADVLREIEIVAENIVGYCREHENQKVPIHSRTVGNIYEHTVYVTILTLKIAIIMNYTTIKLFQIAIGCLLHDLGLCYMEIPVTGLNFDHLTPEEVLHFKKHPIIGFSIVEKEDWITDSARNLILSHHERLDGNGFPLKRKKQCPQCRIIQVVDSFETMLSGIETVQRPFQEICELLNRDSGMKYDKEIVGYLYDCIAKF